ncbi:pentatricopeptide repeat-containing protein At4g14050, mitochondrial isoform X2 [Arabidopsis lyrata subsp. lyrata]|uniref:pentatricopeptide repeat-containing protein At4g14050, mitochondrial isoform X2 n=1 Tax=Arabidopsis lyrata subsp. lyrata TaxID=81972 RepID=UPI000A29E884|nr:pentatricopeptide repeat-containing protein At4g14050, mitochondrial isoform X2 [Arabidopsis lyrata subsp. lyrata]|eukprot:XP_020872047.1 pentatricopeptide repeat-containing protein At4g14050, mitochondrial isoform X2 [Arabidopsis lyrata subsp. lyrata]
MPTSSNSGSFNVALWPTLLSMSMANAALLLMLSSCSTKCLTETTSPGPRFSQLLIKRISLACANLGSIKLGKQVHCHFIVSEYSNDDVVKSSLVDMYAKCRLLDCAKAVFDSIRVKNTISWTAMVSGYAKSGRKEEALELFRRLPVKNLYSWTALISGFVQSGKGLEAFSVFTEMRRERVDILDPLVLSSIVGACANLAASIAGRQVHGLVIALGFDSCVFISNALIDMYAKCSDVIAAKDIFSRMRHRDVVSWTSLIVGMAQHGQAEKALALYDEMVSHGVKPNEVTFVGLIYACSHVGFVAKGRELFQSMTKDYGIRPSLQHYTCLLDLLGRSGLLDEAENLIHTMPFPPDEPTWAALLSACKRQGQGQMGVRIADHLVSSFKPKDPSTYILLSNIYASASLWGKVSEARRKLGDMEVRKDPGYSSVEVRKETEVFYAGETSHALKEDIFRLLKKLEEEMRIRNGYVPDTSWILHDMDEQEKEKLLFWHSERSAVAYGLLKAVPGTPIRIVKNLRVCGDCHVVLKHISEITEREIIVRDATRYHHFKGGKCSCNDFW